MGAVGEYCCDLRKLSVSQARARGKGRSPNRQVGFLSWPFSLRRTDICGLEVYLGASCGALR